MKNYNNGKNMRNIKYEIMWTIVDNKNKIITSPSWKRTNSIKHFTSGFPWKTYKKDGYRVVRVKVTVIAHLTE